MTNFEFAKKLVGDMAICVDSCARKAEDLYARSRRAPTNLVAKMPESFAYWMYREADVALSFDVGDFVQFDSRGEKTYGVVESYWRSNLEGGAITGLYVDTVSGVQTVDASSVSKADLPESVLRLAKARLQANCPLKETACAG